MSNERLEVLGGLPLFEPLSPDERERLAAGCRMRTFARGAALFREGERADGMHIVLRGVVKVVRFAPDGREMVLHLVRKGNTIGEAAMFQKGTFPASAVAVDDVETLQGPHEVPERAGERGRNVQTRQDRGRREHAEIGRASCRERV